MPSRVPNSRSRVPSLHSSSPRRRLAPHRPPGSPSLRRRPRKTTSLRRAWSEPDLRASGSPWEDDVGSHRPTPFRRFMTCTDVFTPSSPLLSEGPRGRYLSNNTKVLVNVTVEGSPGPVRVLVKLDATVAETIKAVLLQYRKERRSPLLSDIVDGDNRLPASSFQLYRSYFSFEGINEAEKLGDVGGRSFFLRRKMDPEAVGGEIVTSKIGVRFLGSNMLTSFIMRRLSKIGRRARKIWAILGCMGHGG